METIRTIWRSAAAAAGELWARHLLDSELLKPAIRERHMAEAGFRNNLARPPGPGQEPGA